MNMNINKTGNNNTTIIKNRNPAIGNDSGLNSGNNTAPDLHVGGNKTPVNEHIAALDEHIVHIGPPFKSSRA